MHARRPAARAAHDHARQLLDTEAPFPASASAAADVTVVTSARQLQAAVDSGAQDILVRAHLDLTGIPLALQPAANVSRVATVLAQIRPSTRSIRVRPGSICSTYACSSRGGAIPILHGGHSSRPGWQLQYVLYILAVSSIGSPGRC